MYFFNGTNYVQYGNKIVATDAIGSAQQGQSVSLDGSGAQLIFGGVADSGKTFLLNICNCCFLLMPNCFRLRWCYMDLQKCGCQLFTYCFANN